MSKNIETNEIEDFLTEAEAMKFMKISRSTLYRLKYENSLPFYRIGDKLIRYRKSDINNWILGTKES
jgi:excisionase family DNA binding protein